MVQILCMRKWPNCAKLTDKPKPAPPVATEPEPEPKLEQATSILKLPEPELGPKKDNPKIVTPDSVLDLAKVASEKQEVVPKRDTVLLDSSGLSKDGPEKEAPREKLEGLCNGLDKVYIARIREAIRKKKSTAEARPTVGKSQLDPSSDGLDDWIEKELESAIIVGFKPASDKKKAKQKIASSEELDDWIERELESGIIVGSKPGSDKKNAKQKNEVIILDTSSEDDDLWIEKELEEGIIVDSKPVGNKKMKSTGESVTALKLEKFGASKAWRGQKREMEAGVDLSSKRQRH